MSTICQVFMIWFAFLWFIGWMIVVGIAVEKFRSTKDADWLFWVVMNTLLFFIWPFMLGAHIGEK